MPDPAEKHDPHLLASIPDPAYREFMESRIFNVERILDTHTGQLAAITAQLAVLTTQQAAIAAQLAAHESKIRDNYATKADLHRELHAQSWRFVNFIVAFNSLLVGAVYFVARYVH